ncbi:MAG: hypothetical protein KDC10_15055, partial [Calditrichaeota bacterium]|nr:hypothetical protein [Calditrichota bacterium]
ALDTFQPTGPDSWGYRIFDMNDAGGPVHEWSSIAGIGAPLLSGGNAVVADTGFSFSFYGVTYTTLAVNRRGYACAGTTLGMTQLDNIGIPTTQNPSRLVAVRWDLQELQLTGSIWGRYSAEHGGYVVEWDYMREEDSNSDHSSTGLYQLVLLDPALHPELGEDAAFLLHFHEVLDGGFTTGIENASGTVGVQYVYNDVWGAGATPVTNDCSLLITTAPAGFNSGCVVVQPPSITDVPLPNTPWATGPWTVSAEVQVDCDLFDAMLEYRVNGASWQEVVMDANDWTHVQADIPGPLAAYDLVEYRITATPPSAPGLAATTSIRSFTILEISEVFQEDFSDGLGDFQSVGVQEEFQGSTWSTGGSYGDYACGNSFNDFNCESGPDAILQSPVLNCSNSPNVYLGYTWYQRANWIDCGPFHGSNVNMSVRISTDGGDSWSSVGHHQLAATSTDHLQVTQGSEQLDISSLAAHQAELQIQIVVWDYMQCCTSCVGQIVVYSVIGWTELTIMHDPLTGQETLSWQPVGGIDSYQVYTADSPDGPWSLVSTVSGTSLALPADSGTHLYQVRYILPE